MNGIQLIDYELDIDVIKDADGKIVQGLVVGDVTAQNQALILRIHKGELKENPSVGCGIEDMLLDSDPLFWRTEIREQLEMDGQTVNSIEIGNDSITIDANY